ncbi:uncharacterized protein LOC132800510 [Ziziphus jujuba]|uniref:Uncharacterized protein LOC132800510 n=1 Tax=Ziziphus jujuba TaxID=326968 RepID=A0ABM4A0Z6_ZIZJJ|nr:uncharacterized protein LOC132800510 [Ziziphus jujuba]
MVKALIEVNKDMCLVRDEDGKIRLHYVAMRGRVKVIEMLISVEPKSIQEKLNEGETNDELINSKDKEYGNTILHLAVMLKQIKLVSIPEVKTGVSSLNRMGLIAFGMIEEIPKDFKSIKILNILQDALDPQTQNVTAQTTRIKILSALGSPSSGLRPS